ncbi:MAG: LuxR C-terminal-related transcriptional regulator, partial [Spirochaetaceae bacterium]|nr:LuxR C-terminal-related transcriptional regulator [Spirochaetaceae bacterium]
TEEALLLRYVERSKFLISLRRFSEAADTCREAIELFAGRAGDPLAGIILTAAYNNLGDIAFYNCTTTRNYDFSDYEKAASYFSTASEWSPACQCVIRGYICPVGSPAEEGEFEKAIAAIGAFIPYTVCSLNGGYYGLDSLAKTEYAWFRGDLAQVETYARQAVYQAREKNQWEIEAWALFFLLRINLYAGNRAELRELIKQLDALLAISEYFNRYAVNNVIMGWFYAQLGAAERVGPWLKNDYYELDFDDRSGASFQTLVKAKCCFAVKRYTATLHILNTPPEETARSPDRHAPFLLGRLEQNLLRAAALIRRSAEDTETSAAEALRCLEEAWRMAAPNGLDMPFIELGEEMRILAGRALRDKNCAIPRDWLEEIRGKASAYRKRLLKIYQGPEYSPKPREAPSLSWRETEVLRTLSLGWSREQIAEKMALSVNTVKAEIRSIYAKLGAVNRVDAVRIALELNIFSR